MSDEREKTAELPANDAGSPTRLFKDEKDPLVGRVVDGKYIVEAVIGAGGMGKVYRGRNQRTDSPVAIKTLLPDLLVDETLAKRFEVEAKAASNLRHPNTIRIFDFGLDGDLLFMVMELLDGMSLEAALKQERILEPARVLRIVREVCRSLEEAHGAGLVHRDIKPDNIFLNRVGDTHDEHVKVLDFGVAKLRNKQYGGATLTQAGMIFGTPRYMSPEQARAQELDGRSDIYALGVIMYEALTGRAPFVSDDPVATLIMHVNEPVPSFHTTNPELRPMADLEALVMRCLEKSPDKRFDDVRNLLNAIEGVGAAYGLGAASGPSTALPANTERTRLFSDGPNTPAVPRSQGFQELGISTGEYTVDPQKSRYTLGSPRDFLSRSRSTPVSPVGKIAAIVGALLVLAGLALVLLVRGGGSTAETPVAPSAEAAAGPGPSTAPPTPPPPSGPSARPVVEIASYKGRDAFTAASAHALARVVVIPLGTDPPDAGARAKVQGTDSEPVPLPHTFVFTKDPSSPPARVAFEISADGYRDATHEAALASAESPIVVRLRRRSSDSGGRSSGSVAVPPPPSRRDNGNGGFVDPYAR